MTWLQRIVAAVNRPSRDTRLILERIAIMDARIESLTATFNDYVQKVQAYVAAAESHKQTVEQAVAEAVQKDNDDEDVDIAALQKKIQEAAAQVPQAPQVPTFQPSNN